jgi:uncharacterized protein YuzE
MSIDLKYSPRADALYVRFTDRPVAYTDDISQGPYYERGIDYDDNDVPVGVEFLNASKGVDLTGVPLADEIAPRLHEYDLRQVRRQATAERE